MPLASTLALQWYGPACAAMVVADAVGDAPTLAPNQIMRAGVAVVGTGDAPLLRPYRMRNFALSVEGLGDAPVLAPNKEVRAALVVKVAELSQDDVVGAVQSLRIEGDLTLVEALRLLLAVAASNATGLGASESADTLAFKSLDGTKTRIAGTVDTAGARTITVRDPT